MTDYGFWALLPTLAVLLIALITKKTFEALVGGALVGFVMISKENFFTDFIASLLAVMKNETIGWVILVCGLFGSLIHLIVRAGGSNAFAEFMLKYIKSRKGALLMAWLLGLLIFIDDYLNALTLGTSMKKVTDRFRISREMLAYVVDSTAAPVCVLVPFSTWAIYVAGLLESIGFAHKGHGLTSYLAAVPFTIYGWAAFLIVPLVALGIIPNLGAMKQAEVRAQGGQTIPPGSENVSLEVPESTVENPHLLYFILPISVLIGATIAFGIDALKGVLVAVVFTVIYYRLKKVITFDEASQEIFGGFKTMLYALAVIIMSFVMKDINDKLQLTQFVIENVSPLMNKHLLPAIAFVSLSAVTFATGSFWGVYAISLPIVLPLAENLQVNPLLAIGSVISAGAFGSHACFYGDATVLSSAATGCHNMAHVITQLPYALLASAITVITYLVLGFVM
jgi:Na+/H+ antiporter NhaC